jgi:hypothetical protein
MHSFYFYLHNNTKKTKNANKLAFVMLIFKIYIMNSLWNIDLNALYFNEVKLNISHAFLIALTVSPSNTQSVLLFFHSLTL